MSRIQRIVLSVGLVAITILSLRPPYAWEYTTYLMTGDARTPYKIGSTVKSVEHRWVWSTPEKGIQEGYLPGPENDPFIEFSAAQIDWLRLSIYVGLAATITLCLAFGVFRREKK